MIRLSVIVPFYNVEKYIEQCIRSLYDQDIPLEEYEVICVDDCSPDGSRAIVERLQKEYPTLQLIIHERNKKLGGARNTGLKVAKGRYVMFVDSDDQIEPNVLAKLLTESEENHLDLLHFDFVFNTNGTLTTQQEPEFPRDVVDGQTLFLSGDGWWWNYFVTAWRKIYSADFLRENDLYFVEHIMYEDNDFSIRCFVKAKRTKHIPVSVYHYCDNPDSIIRGDINSKHLQYWLINMINVQKIAIRLPEDREPMRKEAIKYVRNMAYKVIRGLKMIPHKEKREIRSRVSISSVLMLHRVLTHRSFVKLIYNLYI